MNCIHEVLIYFLHITADTPYPAGYRGFKSILYIEVLLGCGAHIDAVDGVGRTALMTAVRSSQHDVVKELTSRGRIKWIKGRQFAYTLNRIKGSPNLLLFRGGFKT